MLSICLAHVESENKRATSGGGGGGGSSSLLYIHIGSETRGDCRLYFPPLLQPVFPQPPRRVFVFFSPIARIALPLSPFLPFSHSYAVCSAICEFVYSRGRCLQMQIMSK